MKLIVQPEDGLAPLRAAIGRAKDSIAIVIFRFDVPELEDALQNAVIRGVAVRALVAHTNKNGEKQLRKLEHRLLSYGVTIDRTDDTLVRYHGKILVVDRKRVFILGFNYTRADIFKSRSFGVMVSSRPIVHELMNLIEADANRRQFRPRNPNLVVSPENSRSRLAAFIGRARQELLIYDPNVSDDAMIKILKSRVKAGVRVRILGKLEKKWQGDDLPTEALASHRLHVRAIIRDGRHAFVGSQSLRKLELEGRREVGIILKEAKVVARLVSVFEEDWAKSQAAKSSATKTKRQSA